MKIKREIERFELIFEKELEEFLKRNGVYDEFITGKIKCNYCGKIITFDSLGVIVVKKGKLRFTCNRLECLRKVSYSDNDDG